MAGLKKLKLTYVLSIPISTHPEVLFIKSKLKVMHCADEIQEM